MPIPAFLEKLVAMRSWPIGEEWKKEKGCRSPLDRANHCIALKDLMQCGDQPEREKRRPLHLEKLTNHSIPAARWRCKSTVLVVRELAVEFDSQ